MTKQREMNHRKWLWTAVTVLYVLFIFHNSATVYIALRIVQAPTHQSPYRIGTKQPQLAGEPCSIAKDIEQLGALRGRHRADPCGG